MNETVPRCVSGPSWRDSVATVGPPRGTDRYPPDRRGEDNARRLRGRLAGITFTEVLVSPLQRARQTCDQAGFGGPHRGFPGSLVFGQVPGTPWFRGRIRPLAVSTITTLARACWSWFVLAHILLARGLRKHGLCPAIQSYRLSKSSPGGSVQRDCVRQAEVGVREGDRA